MFHLRSRLLLCAMGFLFAGASAVPQVSPMGGGYLIRYKFKAGATMQYNVDVSAHIGSGGGTPMKFAIPYTIKVKSVSNGIATVEATGTLPKTGGPGSGGPQTAIVRIDSRGRSVGEENKQGGLGPVLPEKPVKIGQTWTGSMSGAIGGMSGIGVVAKFKLVGLKMVGGRKVAQLELTTSLETKGGARRMTASGKGMLNLRVEDGSLDSMDLEQSITVPMEGTKPIQSSATYKLTRKS